MFHFASNPDIAKAATEPDIDFWEGTYLTQNLLEAMRITDVQSLIYASGSGVYGETARRGRRTISPLLPISTYGVSKLACEAMIRAYTHMYDFQRVGFGLPTSSGHGKLMAWPMISSADYSMIRPGSNPRRWKQRKSYIHVDDVLDAILTLYDRSWERLRRLQRRHRGLRDRSPDRRPRRGASGRFRRGLHLHGRSPGLEG